MESKTFVVPNISCRHCVMTIKREVGELPGVTNVSGDVGTKTITVAWNAPTEWGKIAATLREIGYPPAE